MSNRTLFARGLPEAVRITETYEYHQEISRNSTYQATGAPQGKMVVSVAYDGQSSFPRLARMDVERQIGRGHNLEEGDQALIGYLAFAGHSSTTLAQNLGLSSLYNILPLKVPLSGQGLTNLEYLTDDRHVWMATTNYEIDEPKVWPIQLDIRLRDEDAVWPNIWMPDVQKDSLIDTTIVRAIVQQLRARHDLALSMRVGVDLPGPFLPGNIKPTVSKLTVGLPRFTALRSFDLHTDEPKEPARHYLFEPLARSLEWYDIGMSSAGAEYGAAMHRFLSSGMTLAIRSTSELHRGQWEENAANTNPSETLSGQVVVDIPNWLLSGTQVRLFDGLGSLVRTPPLHLLTKLIINYDLVLDDVFSRRRLSLRQHLYFDQIIPNDMRLLDIRTALADRGFRILADEPLKSNNSSKPGDPSETIGDRLEHFIVASRPEGPDSLTLWLVVAGKELPTERRSQIPGGHRYTSTFESGELILYIVGELPGNAMVLTRELNALQRALRERFSRMRSRR